MNNIITPSLLLCLPALSFSKSEDTEKELGSVVTGQKIWQLQGKWFKSND